MWEPPYIDRYFLLRTLELRAGEGHYLQAPSLASPAAPRLPLSQLLQTVGCTSRGLSKPLSLSSIADAGNEFDSEVAGRGPLNLVSSGWGGGFRLQLVDGNSGQRFGLFHRGLSSVGKSDFRGSPVEHWKQAEDSKSSLTAYHVKSLEGPKEWRWIFPCLPICINEQGKNETAILQTRVSPEGIGRQNDPLIASITLPELYPSVSELPLV